MIESNSADNNFPSAGAYRGGAIDLAPKGIKFDD
jgi:hypothetical protein